MEKYEIKTDGEYLSNLRFADNILLVSTSCDQLQNMIEQLNGKSKAVGLQMNKNKTKIMSNRFAKSIQNIMLHNSSLEAVSRCVYLGQIVTTSPDKTPELQR